MLPQIAFAAGLVLAAASLPAAAQIAPAAVNGLKAGDVLFKGAGTATGTRVAAGWSNGDRRWGHTGIVVTDGAGHFSVIHADTGEGRAGGDVRRVPLAEYLSDVSTLGHYTVALTGEARANYLAYAEATVGLPFDRRFSLGSVDRLYCSELVWRALSAGAGKDILPDKSERFGRIYVSVSDLSDNPLLSESAVITSGEQPGK
jgi:uncharacterized protein YycO